ncbi:MAG TPA: S49 family peptidase, partial [Chroococcidiopsis sp.]
MRDFFKYTLATFVGLVLFATVGLGGLVFLVIAVATSARDAGPRVDNKSVLTFDLSTEITDNAPAVSPSEVVSNALSNPAQENKRVALRTVLNAIESAATDDKIVGLYLYGNISPGGAGLTTLGEIRQALEAFHAEKKPIIAYGTSWSERDYYLVSIADTIALNPTGFLEINGFASESTFFAGALQRFGIGIQAVRVGRYKSAVEPFIRSDRSPEEREQTQKLLT